MPRIPVVLDSVTHLKTEHRGRVALCASHGGIYTGHYAASMGLAAVVLNDAGIGRERAGVAGLEVLAELGVPAAAVSHRTARIGDGAHGATFGVISTVNGPAGERGLAPGMPCAEALSRLAAGPLVAAADPGPLAEARREVVIDDGTVIVVLDSISLVTPSDRGRIVVAASHGGLLGGRPESAVKHPVFAVVTNDADRGADDAGISRLPALEAMGIAGACVSAFSARIGDGSSTLEDGFVSAINKIAEVAGARIGQSCRELVAVLAEARSRADR
jgi:hypothetical protein